MPTHTLCTGSLLLSLDPVWAEEKLSVLVSVLPVPGTPLFTDLLSVVGQKWLLVLVLMDLVWIRLFYHLSIFLLMTA